VIFIIFYFYTRLFILFILLFSLFNWHIAVEY
jgi:hypothetical protein